MYHHALVRAKVAYFTHLDRWTLRGVVHVGANDGEEMPWYLHHNHRPIIGFEPHPDAFEILKREYGDKHGVICVPIALGASDGELELHVPRHLHPPFADDTRSSTGMKVNRDVALKIGLSETEWTTKTVPIRRFDSWATETCIDMSPFDTLVVDVQGMELDVLKGFGRYLDGFKYLNIECSETPLYDGEAPAQDVIDYLAQQGFQQETPIESHDDIMFMRVRGPKTEDDPAEVFGSERPNIHAWLRENGYPDLQDGARIAPPLRRKYREANP